MLKNKEKLVCMLAPSFVIDYPYPHVIGMLKRLGFSYVIEVAYGAHATNTQMLELLRTYPEKRFIASPCPSIVRFIRTKYPNLVPYLAKTDSPMSASAKLFSQKYPHVKPVFVGPCLVKRLEAKEEWPELGITAITYKDLQMLFDETGIRQEAIDEGKVFDMSYEGTRLYPISGGLLQSSHIKDVLGKDEYIVASGLPAVEKALRTFIDTPSVRLLDILFCDGGCIDGKGIISTDPLEKRRGKVISHWHKKGIE